MPDSTPAMTKAAADVLAERARQISEEGWTAENDDGYTRNEMARAAACYTLSAAGIRNRLTMFRYWPFLQDWWKPTTPRRDLVKAGALILAEIERLDRVEAAEGGA